MSNATICFLFFLAGCAPPGDSGAVDSVVTDSVVEDSVDSVPFDDDLELDIDSADPIYWPEDASDSGDCDEETPVNRTLAVEDGDAMASAVRTRARVLAHGNMSAVQVRTQEFMNYYSFGYAAADEGELGISAAMVEEGDASGYYWLALAIRAEARDVVTRRPMNLTVLVDSSDAMSSQQFEVVYGALTALAGQLRAGDVISVLDWSGAVALDSLTVSGSDDAALLSAAARVDDTDEADFDAALVTAYDLARSNASDERINRLILFSEGDIPVKAVSADLISAQLGADERGIALVAVGVGVNGIYRQSVIDVLADLGGGPSLYLDSEAEAERMFGDRFIRTLDVAARDLTVRLDLPAGFQVVRPGDETSTSATTEIESQRLSPNDNLVLYRALQTCAPDALSETSAFTVTVSWRDDATGADHVTSQVFTLSELLAADLGPLYKGALLYETAGLMRQSKDIIVDPLDVDRALANLEIVQSANPGDEELPEIRAMLNALLREEEPE